MNQHEHNHSHDLNVKKVDRLSQTRVRLTVEFSSDSIASEEKRMTNRFVQSARIPGFRPGKAPTNIVKTKFKDDIRKEVLSHLLEAGLQEALQKTNLMPVNRPKINFDKFDEGKAFEFHAEFEVEPQIEMKKYKKIPLKKLDNKVDESEVEKTFDTLRDRLASIEPLDAKKAEKGNFAVVEVAFEMKDGSKKEPAQTYTVEVGMDKLLPKIDAALLKMSVGETERVDEKFPEDYQDKALAGKEAFYDVKLVELKKKVLPALDDAFAAQLKEGATLEQITKEVRENLQKGREQDNDRAQRQEIVDYLIKNNQFEVPNSMIDAQTYQIMQYMEQDLKRARRTLKDLTKEELAQIKTRAENMVRSSLLLREVAVTEKITLDEQRVNAKIDGIAASMGQTVEEAVKYLTGKGMLDRLKDEVLTDQVFEFLISNAEVK